jgi:hypothetical protein
MVLMLLFGASMTGGHCGPPVTTQTPHGLRLFHEPADLLFAAEEKVVRNTKGLLRRGSLLVNGFGCVRKMVVVAVFGELVSASDFPVYREFTGKIGGVGFRIARSGRFCSD